MTLFYSRYGDNIQKVWSLRFAAAGQKSLHELQEFFLTIYPHTQLGGAKRVVSVYARGQQAAAGRPNGEDENDEDEEDVAGSDQSDGEGEGGDNSDTESRSSSNSGSGSNSCMSGSDNEDGAEDAVKKEEKVKTVESASVAVHADPLSNLASGASAVPAAITTATTGVDVVVGESDNAEQQATGRKRRSVEDKDNNEKEKEGRLVSTESTTERDAAVSAAKRRRR